MFSRSKFQNKTSQRLFWLTVIITVAIAQALVIQAFRKQQSRFLVSKSMSAMSRPGYAAPAEPIAKRAVELNKHDGYAWFNYGTSVYLQQRFAEAAAIFAEGIGVLPHSYNALRLMAFSHYSIKDFKQATEEFSEYLTMMPNPPVSPELVFGRAGLSALRVGQLADASYALLRATPLEQNKADNLRTRIMTAVLGNRPAGALYATNLFRFYAPQEELNPFDLLTNAIRGGKLPQAIAYLEAILPDNQADQSVLKATAAAYSSAGQPQKAEALITDAVKAQPESPTLRLVLGDILFSQKRYSEATVQYDEHLRLYPDSPLRADIEQKKKAAVAAP